MVYPRSSDMADVSIPRPPSFREVQFADGLRQIPEWQTTFLRGDEDQFTYGRWVAERVNAKMLGDYLHAIVRPLGH